MVFWVVEEWIVCPADRDDVINNACCSIASLSCTDRMAVEIPRAIPCPSCVVPAFVSQRPRSIPSAHLGFAVALVCFAVSLPRRNECGTPMGTTWNMEGLRRHLNSLDDDHRCSPSQVGPWAGNRPSFARYWSRSSRRTYLSNHAVATGDALRFLAGEVLPPGDDHIAIRRIEFHEERLATRLLRANERRSTAPEQIQDVFARA